MQTRPLLVAALSLAGPNVPWNRGFLTLRAETFRVARDPRAAQAQADLNLFLLNEAQPYLRRSTGDFQTGNTAPAEPPKTAANFSVEPPAGP